MHVSRLQYPLHFRSFLPTSHYHPVKKGSPKASRGAFNSPKRPLIYKVPSPSPQYYHEMSLVTTTLLQDSPPPPFPITSLTKTCHQCGAELSHSHPPVTEDAQNRIQELEAQVRILTGKATAAGTFSLPFCSPQNFLTTYPLHSTSNSSPSGCLISL